VDPTRLKRVISAMRRWHYNLLEVSRVCKIPASGHINHPVLFLRFQNIRLSCCTGAAQLPHFFC
jgi:hypothetical protein